MLSVNPPSSLVPAKNVSGRKPALQLALQVLISNIHSNTRSPRIAAHRLASVTIVSVRRSSSPSPHPAGSSHPSCLRSRFYPKATLVCSNPPSTILSPSRGQTLPKLENEEDRKWFVEVMQTQAVDVIKRMKEITLVMKTPEHVLEYQGVTTADLEDKKDYLKEALWSACAGPCHCSSRWREGLLLLSSSCRTDCSLFKSTNACVQFAFNHPVQGCKGL